MGNEAERGGAISNQSFSGQLRVTNGLFDSNIGGTGGALHNFNAADAVVRNSTFLSNVADGATGGFGGTGGGAIDTGGSGAAVIILDSVLHGNRVTTVFGGGALDLRGTAQVVNSLLTDNDAGAFGAGAIDAQFGSLKLVNSLIEGSNGGSGGAIQSEETPVEIWASRLVDNFASFMGGAIYAWSSFALDPAKAVVIRDSLLEGNEADTGGGIYTDRRRVEIQGSTFAGNVATQVGLPGGGALYAQVAELEVLNSTFSGNSGGTATGAIHLNQATPAVISGSTIVGNSAFRRGGLSTTGSPVALLNTIVAGNTATSGDGSDDCLDLVGSISDLGGNIDGSGTCNVATTIPFAGLQVATLEDNGGATPTHALLPGSAAIDFTSSSCPETNDADQRGAPRDGLCDAGAFEAGVTLPVLGFVQATTTLLEGSDAQGVVDIVITNQGGIEGGAPVTVFVTLNGTAARSFDFEPTTVLPLEIPIPVPGASSVVAIELDVFDDAREEGDETVVLSLALAGPAMLGDIPRHVVTILDDEVTGYCGELQREVQAAVGAEDERYRNHGRYVSTVNRTIKQLSSQGFVTKGCRGCIISQFARRVPPAEQIACGDPGPL